MFSDVHAILFDFDGTLVDCSELICFCFNSALEKYGIRRLEDDRIKAMIGRPLRQLFEEQARERSADLLVGEYKRVFAAAAPGRSSLMSGTRELLETLDSRVKLGIVTSRSSAGTWKMLRSMGLRDHFSAVVGIEDVENTKPHPEPVLSALRRLGVAASEATFVGDTVYDVEAGARAGTQTVGVTTGPHSRRQLLAAGADYVVADLHVLRTLIQARDRLGNRCEVPRNRA